MSEIDVDDDKREDKDEVERSIDADAGRDARGIAAAPSEKLFLIGPSITIFDAGTVSFPYSINHSVVITSNILTSMISLIKYYA